MFAESDEMKTQNRQREILSVNVKLMSEMITKALCSL